MNDKLEVTLHLERETKGTVLYKTDEYKPAVRNVYVTKSALGEVYPNTIKVTIEAVEEQA